MGRRPLFVTAAVCLLACCRSVASERLPRDYTRALHCSACHCVGMQIRRVYLEASDTEKIDTGSFRLSESGKQPNRRQVPLRSSELHAVTVLDAACTGIMGKYVLFDFEPDVFISNADRLENKLTANFTKDRVAVRGLEAVCTGWLDDNEEELRDWLKSDPPVDEDAWIAELCDESGIIGVCRSDALPSTPESVLKRALELKRMNETIEAEQKAASQSNTTSSGHGNSTEFDASKVSDGADEESGTTDDDGRSPSVSTDSSYGATAADETTQREEL